MAEYKDMYEAGSLRDDIGYVLIDNGNYIVSKDEVLGQTAERHTRVKRDVKIGWEKATGIVITERPSVENLVKEGEQMVKEVQRVVPKAEELASEGSKKLDALVAEGRSRRRPRQKAVENQEN
jgi:hypothetical protein